MILVSIRDMDRVRVRVVVSTRVRVMLGVMCQMSGVKQWGLYYHC